MGLLVPAKNQTAYLKLGILGFQGSGKTFTAASIAIGMTKLCGGTKVAFFDTEKGSDFHVKRFKEAGLQLFQVKSRSFADLVNVIKEAEKEGFSFLIIDSITHVWRELGEAYKKKRHKDRLSMMDWGVLKAEWAQFTDAYINSKIHIAMLGRAGYEYAQEENDDGKKEIVKTGTKMKVEGETGFEPDLLLEMFTDRVEDPKPNQKVFVNKCLVIKDRTDLLNGKTISEPKFEHFLPVIQFLNIGGEHHGVDTTRTSEHIIDNPDFSRAQRELRKQVAIEEIQAELIKAGLSGTAAEATKKRTNLLEKVFGTSAKTAIESKFVEELEMGLQELKNVIKEGYNG